MKKYLLFLLFLAFSTLLAAQQTPRVEQLGNQKRRETYVNCYGYDSIAFTIAGKNDTLIRAYFRDNGRLHSKKWAKDSTYQYDVFGQLREVYYDKNEDMDDVLSGASLSYYYDGKLSKHWHRATNGDAITGNFDRKGVATTQTIYRYIPPSTSYMVENDNRERKISASKIDSSRVLIDSTVLVYDTTFYASGRILSVAHEKKKLYGYEYGDELIKLYNKRWYTKDGALFVDMLPDSLYLIPFKDNVECYYGLKNAHGDTIYTPQFDQIENLTDDFFKAKQGTKVVFMRKDGKILSQTTINDISTVGLDIDYYDINQMLQEPLSDCRFYLPLASYPQYFSVKIGDKFGLMNRQGAMVLPPQYPLFVTQDSAAQYFELSLPDKTPDDKSDNSRAVVDRQGKYLFDNRYPHVELSGLDNFFIFSPNMKTDTIHWAYMGLLNQAGEVLLDPIYCSLKANRADNLFWVGKGKEGYNWNGAKEFKDIVYGLFDPIHRRWVLPCIYKKSNSLFYSNTLTQKVGMVSPSGQVLLPFVYDTLLAMQGNHNALARNGRYQIYNAWNEELGKDTYQYLDPVLMPNQGYKADLTDFIAGIPCFIAKKKDKWGLIDPLGKIVVPFEYDYAGTCNGGYGELCIAFVKGDHAVIFSKKFFPLPEPDDEKIRLARGPYDNRSFYRLLSFRLVGDKSDKIFVVNSKNQVLYPPQYHVVYNLHNWQLLENDAKKRLLLFPQTEKILPFPFKQDLVWADAYCSIGILSDSKQTYFDVVNLKTLKKYHTIQNGGVAIDNASGTYFIKTDAPTLPPILDEDALPEVCKDTFVVDDTNWKMFDSLGNPLTNRVFRYPFYFAGDIGIGAVGDKFGIWRTDGSEIAPPQYENAHFMGFDIGIALYQNIGLKNWLLLLDPKTGKIRIGTGRYDGISRFFGKYALVSLGEKIGLVDTTGREIIAPTSLQNDAINLMDSLNVVNIEARKKSLRTTGFYNEIDELPIALTAFINPEQGRTVLSPDSLKISNALRNRVWHYLLETQMSQIIQRADVRRINREQIFKTYKVYDENCRERRLVNRLEYLFADSLHISFALIADSAANSIFKNYERTKLGWEPKQLSDILNLSRDNTIKINDLLRDKIKKMADTEIDCGESSSFVERTRNAFLSDTKGLSFYFTSKNEYEEFHYVPVLLTWAELKAFRRF